MVQGDINKINISINTTRKEIKKAETITTIAETIIKNGELQFKAAMKAAEYGVVNQDQMIFLLTGKKEND